jgi:hypothetical protein
VLMVVSDVREVSAVTTPWVRYQVAVTTLRMEARVLLLRLQVQTLSSSLRALPVDAVSLYVVSMYREVSWDECRRDGPPLKGPAPGGPGRPYSLLHQLRRATNFRECARLPRRRHVGCRCCTCALSLCICRGVGVAWQWLRPCAQRACLCSCVHGRHMLDAHAVAHCAGVTTEPRACLSHHRHPFDRRASVVHVAVKRSSSCRVCGHFAVVS